MDIEGLLKDPVALGVAAGVVVLVIVIVVIARRSKKPQRRVVDAAAGRARQKLRSDLRLFRDDLKRAVAGAGPVFRKIEKETEHSEVVGHWRKSLKHRISVRAPDLNALKGVARTLGYDAMPIADLDVAWRPLARQVAEYNEGKLDASRTPIATVIQFEKDMQKIVVLVNLCLQKYGG